MKPLDEVMDGVSGPATERIRDTINLQREKARVVEQLVDAHRDSVRTEEGSTRFTCDVPMPELLEARRPYGRVAADYAGKYQETDTVQVRHGNGDVRTVPAKLEGILARSGKFRPKTNWGKGTRIDVPEDSPRRPLRTFMEIRESMCRE